MGSQEKGDHVPARETAGAKQEAPKGMDFSSVMKDAPQADSSDPRVALNNQLSAVFDTVAREENDPKQKVSWAHGEHWRQLGEIDLKAGDIINGRMALKVASDTMHEAPDKPANAEREITDTLTDYASSLTMSNKKADVHAHLQESARIMTDVVARAKMENRSPAELVPLIQQKATTEIDFAKIVGNNTQDASKLYLSTLQTAAADLNDGLKLSSQQPNRNDAKLSEARLHSELGFANKQLNDVDRNNWYNKVWGAGFVGYGQYDSSGEYKAAIDLFNQYKPANEGQKIEVEAEKLTTLGRYISSADKSDKDLPALQKQAEDILREHPNWNLKL